MVTFPVPSGAAAKIRIIDSTTRLKNLPVSVLMEPLIEDFEYMPALPSWSFLIESASGKKALFDLGVPVEWKKLAPVVVDRLKTNGWVIEVEKGVDEVLKDEGVELDGIGSVIWSHWHWDHLGDPSKFPSSTDLVVGPGFKEAYLPGYPSKEDCPVRESDWNGRNLREITFDDSMIKAGQFRAFDFFGDGSFFLMDTPGHAIGHLSGLVRTTSNPDTFMFLGGDLCHHGGEIRPSEHLHLPSEITPNPLAALGRTSCPGAMFEELQTKRSRLPHEPFFVPAMGVDIPLAICTIETAQEADADQNVLFVSAHDDTMLGVADFFPMYANDWKTKGWREQMLWAFLKDFSGAVN